MADLHPTTARHPDEDSLVELALGHLVADARDEVTEHLAVCPDCRRVHDDLVGAVDLVLPAVPRLEPPVGFVTAVLSRIEDQRAAAPAGTTRTGPSRRTVLWAAAAGVLGLASGAGATAYLLRDQSPEPGPYAVPLMTGDGQVGTVSRSFGSDGPMLVIDVTDGPAGKAYTCRVRMLDGTAWDEGEWQLSDDRPNSWIVSDPGEGLTAVELVRADGTVWASAGL